MMLFINLANFLYLQAFIKNFLIVALVQEQIQNKIIKYKRKEGVKWLKKD